MVGCHDRVRARQRRWTGHSLINCCGSAIMDRPEFGGGGMTLNSARNSSAAKVRQRRVAGRFRLRLRRLQSRVLWPLRRMFKSRRTRRRRRNVDERRTWVSGRPLVGFVKVACIVAGIVLLVSVGRALYGGIAGKPSGLMGNNCDAACRNTGFSCDILAGTLGPLFSFAFVYALFLLVRLWLVPGPYVRQGRGGPAGGGGAPGGAIGG